MTEPKRIRRRRTAGWRMPEGAVYVGRPTRWGNPITLSAVAAEYPTLSERQVASLAVRDFEALVRRGGLYPPIVEVRRALAGRDLACWCTPGWPCHADVLLALANGSSS